MARKRGGRPAISVAQTSFSGSQTINVVNTHGLPALADEIYLEIISYIPSVPIPTPIYLPSYPEIRRSRHETFLSLSQTCRSLRRVFWRYLWQRIEVREGVKVGENEVLEDISNLDDPNSCCRSGNKKSLKKYALELVRQLEIVAVRNPDLVQHINYLDVFIGDYSYDTIIAELARCMSLFSNLHTVQIDITKGSKRHLEKVFKRSFQKYTYPQIRNVFIMSLSRDLLSSCPEAKRIGFTQESSMPKVDLLNIPRICPRLEVFDDFGDNISRRDILELVAKNLPALRHISISPFQTFRDPSSIDDFAELNHLQSITIVWKFQPFFRSSSHTNHLTRRKDRWVEAVKKILVTIQLRDNLEKFVIVKELDGTNQTITLKPTRIENLDV